ncbi:MAG: 16S rRNA (cytosine(1402)-N(4))-methyltransferase RsmH [bacterium]|nr:16S rRNA (cytosine(1402)-N(4))-methyltransferase RsmH [bacterium]
MNMTDYHIPVLLNEVVELLQVKKGGRYIDCTYGGGGHTKGIEAAGGIVLGIDQDPEAHAPIHGNFAHLKEIAIANGFDQVDGILMDLGVSSHQLETNYRGFSFNKVGNLDMRMDQTGQTVTALDLINAGSEKELAKIFREFGEENFAGPIARAIKKSNIQTTDDLAEVILRVRHTKDRTHPATRVFQALRIAVNDELNSLKEALPQAVELLKPGGKLAVISFHSLEDRIVKKFMGKSEIVTPTDEEIARNPRARSGKLRIYEKINS